MALFDWFKTKSETSTASKQQPVRPNNRDWRDDLTANSVLTKGLYHNSYPGLKLAGALAWAPIAVPVFFMGVPVPRVENEADQEVINDFLESKIQEMTGIHIQSHREGTIWVWPRYSAEDQTVVWEFIPDDSVTDIIRDINTGKVIQIITDEQIHLQIDYDRSAYIRRRRTFTRQRVTMQWIEGQNYVPSVLRDRSYRNPVGILPIPFSNNRDGDEVRGHSDYERIIPDLKSYHDIDKQEAFILAKFTPKMIQNGTAEITTWLANNGWDAITDIDVAATDFIYNRGENEKTEYIWPESLDTTYSAALKRRYRKIVEGSGVPEIIWGVKTEGNHASAEEQMDVFVKYVEGKRTQKNRPYQMLFQATLQLMSMAGEFATEIPDMTIEWNALDSLSESTKSEIFNKFAQGIAYLIDSGGATKEQIHKLWMNMYPEATDDDFELFRRGLSDMAKHKAFKDEKYTDIMDLSGEVEETIEPDMPDDEA